MKNDIWDKAIDDPVLGFGGPIEYKHIEWIKIPSQYSVKTYKNSPDKFIKQDFSELAQHLENIGKFPTDILNDNFFIYGYKV